MSVQSIRISEIVTDAGTQVRARINLALVAEYAERMEAGDVFPPIEVHTDGLSMWLVDGFHRLRAMARLKRETIEANVVPCGNLRDAQIAAIRANQNHGERLAFEDRRRAVLLALGLCPQDSDQQIARLCRVSPTTVGKLRLEVEGANIPVTERVTAGGKVARGGRKKAASIHMDTGPASEPVPQPVAAKRPLDLLIEEGVSDWPMNEFRSQADGPVCQLCGGHGKLTGEGTKRWNELLAYEEAAKKKSRPADERADPRAALPPLPPATAPRLSLDGLANINSQRERYKGPQIKKGDEKRAEAHAVEYERSEDSRASRFEDAPRRTLVQHANGGGR